MTKCPSDRTLAKYLQGELDDAGNAQAETHVETCPRCAARLDQMGNVSEVAELRVRLGDAYGAPEIALPRPVAPGTIGRLGRFDVETKLGSGGMGVVYRAFDTTLKRPVAIKVIRPELACVAGFRNLFAREAETAASVRNDYVVGIHHVESSSTPDSPSYLVMEWVEGENLKHYLDRRREREEKVTVRTAAKIAWEIARGLAAIHAKGLIHRDIKPANILLDRTARRARITDFGLARPIDGSEERVTLTTGAVGTPEYMSPEQFTDPRAVDELSDLYSTGVVLYEMLTGQTPFSGSSHHQLSQQVPVAKPKPPRALDPNIPIELETICLACLDKEKGHRFADAGALADDLMRFMNHEPILKKRPTLQRRLVLFERRHRPLLRFVASFLVLAFMLVGFIVFQRGQIATVSEAKRKADETASKAKEFGAKQSNLAGEKTKEAALRKDREEFTRYISDIKEAYLKWDGNAMNEMRILLDRQIPRAGAKDWRGAEWYYLDDLDYIDHQKPEVKGFVRDARFCPDGERMAALVSTAKPSATQVHIWKFTSLKPERTLVLDSMAGNVPDQPDAGAPLTGPEKLAFSPDGRLIAATERIQERSRKEGLVKVWETQTGTELFSASGGAIAGKAVIFSPDGRYVIAGGYNNSALVWELPGGKLRWTLLGYTLATTTWLPAQELPDPGSGNGNYKAVTHLLFNPAGNVFYRDTVRLSWPPGDPPEHGFSSPSVPEIDMILAYDGQLNGMALSRDRAKNSVRLFSPKDNNPKKSFAQDRIITSDKGRIECAAFGPWRLAISSQNRTLTVMEFGLNSESNLQGKIMRGHTGTVGGIRFGEGREGPNSLLAFNSHSYGRNALTVWGHDFGSPRKPFFDFESQNARRKNAQPRVPWPPSLRPKPRPMSISGRWEYRVMGNTGVVEFFDQPEGKGQSHKVTMPVNGFRYLVISADGTRVAVPGIDRSRQPSDGPGIFIVDIASGKTVQFIKLQGREPSMLQFDSEGRTLLSSLPVEGVICLWDVESGKLIRQLKKPGGYTSRPEFSPDNRRIASWNAGDMIDVWDVESGELTQSFQTETGRVAWAFYGNLFAVPVKGHGIQIWDLDRKEMKQKLIDRTERMVELAFYDHGKRLVASDSQKLTLWAFESENEICSIPAPRLGTARVPISIIARTLEERGKPAPE